MSSSDPGASRPCLRKAASAPNRAAAVSSPRRSSTRRIRSASFGTDDRIFGPWRNAPTRSGSPSLAFRAMRVARRSHDFPAAKVSSCRRVADACVGSPRPHAGATHPRVAGTRSSRDWASAPCGKRPVPWGCRVSSRGRRPTPCGCASSSCGGRLAQARILLAPFAGSPFPARTRGCHRGCGVSCGGIGPASRRGGFIASRRLRRREDTPLLGRRALSQDPRPLRAGRSVRSPGWDACYARVARRGTDSVRVGLPLPGRTRGADARGGRSGD